MKQFGAAQHSTAQHGTAQQAYLHVSQRGAFLLAGNDGADVGLRALLGKVPGEVRQL